VYNLSEAKRDIASIYSTGLFEDVNITPKEAEDSTETRPKVCACVCGTVVGPSTTPLRIACTLLGLPACTHTHTPSRLPACPPSVRMHECARTCTSCVRVCLADRSVSITLVERKSGGLGPSRCQPDPWPASPALCLN
jgi:hypothetical protein